MTNHSPPTRLDSRAVTRRIDPGNNVSCQACDRLLKFHARRHTWQTICNVYADGKWDRVEHWHPACYLQAGEPYGEPSDG